MFARFPILAGLGLAASFAFAADRPVPVSVEWSGGETSPGICVGKQNWFVTVAPASVDATTENPILSVGETQASAVILHFDADRRLCLIETNEKLGDLTLFTLAPNPVASPGTALTSLSTDSDCRSTIAGKDWSYRGERLEMPLLRIRVEDAEHFCDPGTPLVNESGHVEGLLTDRELAEGGEAHAVPAAQIHKLVSDMARFNRTGPVWIGLLLHDQSSTPEVLEVKPDSPAAQAGFVPGDIVLSLNEAEVSNLDDLTEAIHNLPAGERAKFGVLRGLSKKQLEVVPQFAHEK